MWGGAFRHLILGLLFGVAAAGLFALHDASEQAIRTVKRIGIEFFTLLGLGCIARSFFVKPTLGK